MSDLFLGPGSSWKSPLKDIKILYTHVAIDKLTATLRKVNARKHLVLSHALRFNVRNTKRSKNNVNLVSLQRKIQFKNKDLGNGLLKKSYYTSMLGQKVGC